MNMKVFADKESKQGFWMAVAFMTLVTILTLLIEYWK